MEPQVPSTSDSNNSQSNPLNHCPVPQQKMSHTRANMLTQLSTGEIDQQPETGGNSSEISP